MSPSEPSLHSLLRKHGLSHLSARLVENAKPSIRLTPAALPNTGFRSQFGGDIALLPEQRWPSSGNSPLSMLARIDLAEMPQIASDLPTSGLLSFFYDLEEMPFGGGTDRAGWEVVYTPDIASAFQVISPAVALPVRPLQATRDITVPSFRSIEVLALELTEADSNHYWGFRDDVLNLASSEEAVHRMLGHPDAVQGCMQRTLQFETRGLSLPEGIYSWYEHPLARELMPGAHDWRLLLQIDSDADGFGTYWGDNGKLYFWIHRDDLAARRFDQTWLVAQCH